MKESQRKYKKFKIHLDYDSRFLVLHKFQSVVDIRFENVKFINGFPELRALKTCFAGNNYESGVKIKCKKLEQLSCSQAITQFEEFPVGLKKLPKCHFLIKFQVF